MRHLKEPKRPMWKGGPLDPSVLRGELGSRFLAALLSDFAQKGARTISKLRRERHHDYIKLVVALLPQDIRIRKVELPEMSDEELANLLASVELVAKMHGIEEEPIAPESDERDKLRLIS